MTYLPRHRADVPVSTIPNHYSQAQCSGAAPRGTLARSMGGCLGVCPRHEPESYANSMARHATDSIR